MNIVSSTIRDLLIVAEKEYNAQDAFRFKTKQVGADGKAETVIKSKSYTQLKNDSECFSKSLASLGEQEKHIAIIGSTSYTWVVAYFGIVNCGSVAVPLDAQLSAEELCELLNRADVTTLIYDENKSNVADMASSKCPKLKHFIC